MRLATGLSVIIRYRFLAYFNYLMRLATGLSPVLRGSRDDPEQTVLPASNARTILNPKGRMQGFPALYCAYHSTFSSATPVLQGR